MLLLAFCSNLFSQSKVYKTQYELVRTFLNTPKVLKHFTLSDVSEDSTITIIDVNGILNESDLRNWNGFHVIVNNSGPIIDTINKFNAFHIRTRKRNLLIIQIIKSGKQLSYFLFQPTSNADCNAFVLRKRNGIVIKEIRCGWF